MVDNSKILQKKVSQISDTLKKLGYDISLLDNSVSHNYIKFSINNSPAILYYLTEIKQFTLSFFNNLYHSLLTKDLFPNDVHIIPVNSINEQSSFPIPAITDTNTIYTVKDTSDKISANTVYDIYVDGSFMNNTISSAYVILQNDEKIYEYSFVIDNPSLLPFRNVAGEIKAVEEAIKKAIELNSNEINIHYDYTGLQEWATGNWKRNNELTQSYYNFMKNVNIKINWIKIQAHSTDFWNNYVDKLAKECIINALYENF